MFLQNKIKTCPRFDACKVIYLSYVRSENEDLRKIEGAKCVLKFRMRV